mgnify:FL=1
MTRLSVGSNERGEIPIVMRRFSRDVRPPGITEEAQADFLEGSSSNRGLVTTGREERVHQSALRSNFSGTVPGHQFSDDRQLFTGDMLSMVCYSKKRSLDSKA